MRSHLRDPNEARHLLLSVRPNETTASPGRRHGIDSSPDEIKRRDATIAKIEVLLRLSWTLATRHGVNRPYGGANPLFGTIKINGLAGNC